MKTYADTNFFTNLALPLAFTAEAQGLIAVAVAAGATPFPAPLLLRLEVANAFQRLVYETRHGNPTARVTPEAALMAGGDFTDDLRNGIILRRVHLSESILERQFDLLCQRYTAKEGFRTYDLLHVSAALVLGCDAFWSFDTRARKLAKLTGLKTN